MSGNLPRAKICGITRAEDALLAARLGAWAIGFVLHAESPRAITVGSAGLISALLPKEVLKVGVFVNPDRNRVRTAFREANLTLVQLHGEESPEFCEALGVPYIKALRPARE